MVFCPLPSQNTEEEKFLQQKYLKLKKKKKLLQQQKTPKPEQTQITTQNPLKRGLSESHPKQDPKELAKKLIKSGAISAIKPPEKEKQGFKRSKNSKRKLEQTDKPKYQPFSAVYKSDLDNENGLNKTVLDSSLPTKEKEIIAREETFREKRRDGKAHYVNRDIPSNVACIYVHGIGLTEQLLKAAFAQFGNIIKISCEFNKNCGFVTYESIDHANRAIDTMNGNQVQNITLKVSLARKQPHQLQTQQPFANKHQQTGSHTADSNLSIDAPPLIGNQNKPSTNVTQPPPPPPQLHQQQQQQNTSFNNSNDWSSIAATYEQKNKLNKDRRSLVAYDDIF